MAAQADTSWLIRLPNELLFQILDDLHPSDVGSGTQANRACHQLFTEYYFDRCSKEPDRTGTLGGLWGLFCRAVECDSLSIHHYLSDRINRLDWTGLEEFVWTDPSPAQR
ncbi:hypothetical protein PGQ11_012561 [Apiospora arundinis]|uniref:F-box domain-containing protein n=1 Tax=Apiospora arundinis TaxID=335852 RepID=A0ABR2I2M6_9PEZI